LHGYLRSSKETNKMKKETILRFSIPAIIAICILFVFSFSSEKGKQTSKESMQECCQKKRKSSENKGLIWETFSRQLIFVSN